MGAKARRPRSKEPSSASSVGENGHSNGKMNTSVEYRRKNASHDSPSITANLMARESFTLDDEVPKTPSLNNHGVLSVAYSRSQKFWFTGSVILFTGRADGIGDWKCAIPA